MESEMEMYNALLKENDYCDKGGYYGGWLAERAMVIKVYGLKARW